MQKNKKESTLDLFGQNAKVHKDKNWRPDLMKKQIKERRMPYSEIPQVEDYIGTARAKGFECIEGSLVSKVKEVFTPVIMKINGNVEARLRIFSQGNYTIFTDKGGWEGLDLEEFEKDLDDLLSLYESVSKKSNRIKESAAEDDAAFKEAKSYIKKSYQKYVHKLSIRNGKVDALSLQNFLSGQIGRKLNFHTASGKMFWELSEEEANIEDVNVTLNAYDIRTDLYGRNYDKVRIYINQGSNLKKIDTSCWNKNVRAYRAGVEQNADPVAVELSNIIIPLWNKTKFPGIQSGEIYKSAIMKTKPGTPNIIGSTLDLDRVEALGNMLKREDRVDNVVVEPTNDVAKRVRITFEYDYHEVEILAMVAQFVCQVELSIDCK